MKITKEKLKQKQKEALIYYKNNKKINTKLFGEVRITNPGFNHIEWKNKDHKRDFNEAFTRYICFYHTRHILETSLLYQEYREGVETFKIKTGKKKYKTVTEKVYYYGLVAIVNNDKHRVRIVIKRNENSNHCEFVSVVPAWKKEGYLSPRCNSLFFEDDIE